MEIKFCPNDWKWIRLGWLRLIVVAVEVYFRFAKHSVTAFSNFFFIELNKLSYTGYMLVTSPWIIILAKNNRRADNIFSILIFIYPIT